MSGSNPTKTLARGYYKHITFPRRQAPHIGWFSNITAPGYAVVTRAPTELWSEVSEPELIGF